MECILMSKFIFFILPIFLFACSSESKDRESYIKKCMYPNAAIKLERYSEKYCSCRYDTIRKIYGKPFFDKPIENEEDRKRMDYAQGYSVATCN